MHFQYSQFNRAHAQSWAHVWGNGLEYYSLQHQHSIDTDHSLNENKEYLESTFSLHFAINMSCFYGKNCTHTTPLPITSRSLQTRMSLTLKLIWLTIHHILQVTVMCYVTRESNMFSCHWLAVLHKLMTIKLYREAKEAHVQSYPEPSNVSIWVPCRNELKMSRVWMKKMPSLYELDKPSNITYSVSEKDFMERLLTLCGTIILKLCKGLSLVIKGQHNRQ